MTLTKPCSKKSVPAAQPPLAAPVIAYVLANFAESIALEDLAQAAGLSRFNFCRRFHRECGLPPMRWLWNFRTLLAAEFIGLGPQWSLTDIAFSCGFTSSAHFSRTFKSMFGKSPSQYKKLVQVQTSISGREVGFDDVFGHNDSVVLKAAAAALTAR